MNKSKPRSFQVWKLMLGVVAAACALGVAAATVSAAAPVYTGWSTPVNLGPVVNSAAARPVPRSPRTASASTSLRPPVGGLGGYATSGCHNARRLSSAWGAPVNLGPPINTASTDFVPSFSPDGHWMFFASTRPGGFGGADLYQSHRADIHDNFGWQTPTNLGPNVNTAAAENGNGLLRQWGAPRSSSSEATGSAARRRAATSTSPIFRQTGPGAPPTLIPELSSPAR